MNLKLQRAGAGMRLRPGQKLREPQLADGFLAPRALEFVTSIEAMNSCQDVMQLFRGAIAEFGFDAYLMIAVDDRDFTQRVMASNWNPQWIAIYTNENLKDVDPVRRQVRHSVNAFFWSEASYDPQREPRAKQVMDRAAEFRMKEGFCVPIREGNLIKTISIAGEKPDLSLRVKAVLHIVSLFTYNRFCALTKPWLPCSPSLLTRREREVLRWVSLGKSDWEISTILRISERTARAHVTNAAHKLKAANRCAAVVEALTRGEIQLS